MLSTVQSIDAVVSATASIVRAGSNVYDWSTLQKLWANFVPTLFGQVRALS
jgi:hypothetical protein